MRALQIVSLSIMMLIQTNLIFAEGIFVHPAKASGMEDNASMAEVFQEMIAGYVDASDDFEVSSKDASKNDLYPKIIKTGDAYLIFLKLVPRDGGGSRSEFLKVEYAEELDIGTERLVESVLDDVEPSETRQVGKITSSEQNLMHKKVKTKGLWYYGFGPAVPYGMVKKKGFSQWTFGYGWEMEDNILRLELESASPNNDDDFSLGGIGVTGFHMFSRRNATPFVSATLQRGSYSIYPDGDYDHEDAVDYSGYIVGAGAGYIFFRNTDINVEVSLYTRTILEKVDGKIPTVNGLKVGIFW